MNSRRRKYVVGLCSVFTRRSEGLGRFNALLLGTSTSRLNFSWASAWTFPHEGQILFATILPLFSDAKLFDLKRRFLINIYHACFYTIDPQTGLESLIEGGPAYIQTLKSFTVMTTKLFRSILFFGSITFSVSILICPRLLCNSVWRIALKWTRSCPNSLLWVSLINITAKLPSRVQKINGFTIFFFLRAKNAFWGWCYWRQAATDAYVSLSVLPSGETDLLIARVLQIKSEYECFEISLSKKAHHCSCDL